MTYVPVDLYLLDQAQQGQPIVGAVVRIYDSTGSTFWAEAITDAQGHAGFLLPSSATYQARFFKFACALPNPLFLQVLNPPAVNAFNVKGESMLRPVAQDARFCRASGYFRTSSGAPAVGVVQHYIAKFRPILLEGSALLTERVRRVTDVDGYTEIDLVRFGQYEVTVAGFEDMVRTISVPDLASANLPDLLFPVVDRVIFSPDGPFAVLLSSGDFQVTPQVYASDGELLDGTGSYNVIWGTQDPTVAAVIGMGPSFLTIRPLTAGVTYITATRTDNSIIRIPNTPVTIVHGQITVT